ncbi:MAG: nickel pincer cofactor biosynthesis protein LarB [Desulfovibrio sp.]
MDLDQLLQQFKEGDISTDVLKQRLQARSCKALGATLDEGRTLRKGVGEVVFCEGKSPAQVADIFTTLADRCGRVFGTRADDEKYLAVKQAFACENAALQKGLRYNAESRILSWQKTALLPVGKVVVISAGTSDLQVAEEAAETAEFLGSRVSRHFDCGIAGVHRLLDVLPDMVDASVVVAVAGMDGALPTLVAGLIEPPVIAVPTSIGYGTGLDGVAALMTMLNGCAPGISVVNIDNGFGAGYQAHVINSRSRISDAQIVEKM